MSSTKIKVLYIAGFERSGSTLINRVLGQINDFVACGELRDIWQHGVIENRYCSCGQIFSKCQFWSEIIREAFGTIDDIDANKIFRLQKQTRALTFIKHFLFPLKQIYKAESEEYLNTLDNFYRAIKNKTKCKIIVDSTKASWYGAVLSTLPSIDLYILHITRDPCGVCYSLEKRKQKGEPEAQWYNLTRASLSWNIKNIAVEKLLSINKKRYLRMSFEGFVNDPQSAIKSILDFVEEENIPLSFLKDNTVEMDLNHIITGSPSSRSDTGVVKLKLDEKWKKEMKPKNKALAKFFTLLLSKKYGYFS